MLPTPTARESHGAAKADLRKDGRHHVHLRDVACTYLLPTPAACNPNDGETPESWLARRDRQQPSRAMPLAIAIKLLPTPKASDTGTPGRQPGQGFGPPLSAVILPLLPTPMASEAVKGSQYQTDSRGRPTLSGLAGSISRQPDWGPYTLAIRRWAALFRPTVPDPTELGVRGQPRLSARFVEWMMGLPNGWVTNIPGLSRTAQMRALGNGVVPQQALHALTLLHRLHEEAKT